MNFIWFTYNERLVKRWWKFIKGEGVEPITADLVTQGNEMTTRASIRRPSVTQPQAPEGREGEEGEVEEQVEDEEGREDEGST
jgi:hypothetical protein